MMKLESKLAYDNFQVLHSISHITLGVSNTHVYSYYELVHGIDLIDLIDLFTTLRT